MLNIDTYYINLDRRVDRREQVEKEISGLCLNPALIRRVTAQYTPSNGAIGCANSHAFALSRFLFETDGEYCLVVEDDFECLDGALFKKSVTALLSSHLDWDVVLLASNVAVPTGASPVLNLFKIVNAQTASAYLVRRKFAPKLIKLFYECAELISDAANKINAAAFNHLCAIDIKWKDLQLRHNFYAFLPQISRQRESYSEIENQRVSYGV